MSDTSLKERVAEVAVQCLLDEDLPVETPVTDYESVKLLGSRSVCDSLGLVSYLVALEEQINDTFDAELTLMSERAMSQERSPFRNLDSLVEYIVELLDVNAEA